MHRTEKRERACMEALRVSPEGSTEEWAVERTKTPTPLPSHFTIILLGQGHTNHVHWGHRDDRGHVRQENGDGGKWR